MFVSQIMAERGVRPAEVVQAYRIAREVVGAEADWEAIEELEGKVEPEIQAELMGRVDMLVDAITRWYLVEGAPGDLASTIEAGREGFLQLAEAAPGIGGEELQEARREVAERFAAAGVPEELARTHSLRLGLVHAPAVAAVARATDRSVADVARVFVAIGERLPLNELEEALGALPASRRMERWALQAAREDARRARWDIAERALAGPQGGDPEEALDAFLGRPQRGVPAPRGVHAHALARGRDRPGGVGAGGTAAARTGGVVRRAVTLGRPRARWRRPQRARPGRVPGVQVEDRGGVRGRRRRSAPARRARQLHRHPAARAAGAPSTVRQRSST